MQRLAVLRQPRRVKHELLPGFDLGRHVGELELQTLEVGDRLPELMAHAGVSERLLECAFGESQRQGSHPDASAIERAS